jgi:hypothetical protein
MVYAYDTILVRLAVIWYLLFLLGYGVTLFLVKFFRFNIVPPSLECCEFDKGLLCSSNE